MSDQTPKPQSDLQTKATQIATDVQNITGGIADAIKIVSKVNTWTAICGFFVALPGLLNLIQEIMNFIKNISGDNPQAFISDLGDSFAKLNSAKTEEDRQNAAQAIAKSISRLPTK